MKNSTIALIVLGVAIILLAGYFALSPQTTTTTTVVTPAPTQTTSDSQPVVVTTTTTTTVTSSSTAATSTGAASNTAGPGQHCGGNMATAKSCVAGYRCAAVVGSNLPFGDVGGTCVAD